MTEPAAETSLMAQIEPEPDGATGLMLSCPEDFVPSGTGRSGLMMIMNPDYDSVGQPQHGRSR